MLGIPQCCRGGVEIGAESGVMWVSLSDVLDELLLVCNDGGFINEAGRRNSIDAC